MTAQSRTHHALESRAEKLLKLAGRPTQGDFSIRRTRAADDVGWRAKARVPAKKFQAAQVGGNGLAFSRECIRLQPVHECLGADAIFSGQIGQEVVIEQINVILPFQIVAGGIAGASARRRRIN